MKTQPPKRSDHSTVGRATGNGESLILGEYVSKADLAKEFDVSERSIDRWVRLDILPRPLRLGRRPLFHLATVKAHLANLQRGRNQGRR